MQNEFPPLNPNEDRYQSWQDIYDFDESYRIRSRMLGVLIRDARLHASRSVEECAFLLKVSSQLFEEWELGESAPDLPQLELLAYFLDVPVSHFWSQQLLEQKSSNLRQDSYMQLRHRMIGTLLRIARDQLQYSLIEVSQITNIPVPRLKSYEMGTVAIPMPQLVSLARALNKTPEFFLEGVAYAGDLLQHQPGWDDLSHLEAQLHQFTTKPDNAPYLRVGRLLSQLPADQRDAIVQLVRTSAAYLVSNID